MELRDFMNNKQKAAKLYESRFGIKLNFNNLSLRQAKKMLRTINESLEELRHTKSGVALEKNKNYLKLVTLREAVNDFVRSNKLPTLGEAEIITAAKSLTDVIQNMVVRLGTVQNKELPAIINSIRDGFGIEQATAYSEATSDMIADLIAKANEVRGAFDNAVQVLTGKKEMTFNTDEDEDEEIEDEAEEEIEDEEIEDESDDDESFELEER